MTSISATDLTELPGMSDAAREALVAIMRDSEGRTSIGHQIARKMVYGSQRDIADIVELIKVRIEDNRWNDDRAEVFSVVRRHLGWYAARQVDSLAAVARGELGL